MAKENQSGLMKLFKKHFKKSDDDMEDYDEDLGDSMKPMSEMRMKHRSRRKNPMDTDEEYEEAPAMFDDMDSDDDVYDQLEDDEADYGDEDDEDDNDGEYGEDDELSGEEEDELLPRLPKHQRKNMAIAVITKKMSKPKRKDM